MANLSFSAALPKLFEGSEPKCPCKAAGSVGKLPLPRRGGFQSALLVGGLAAFAKATAAEETAAPCVRAWRPPSSLATHHQAACALQIKPISSPEFGQR